MEKEELFPSSGLSDEEVASAFAAFAPESEGCTLTFEKLRLALCSLGIGATTERLRDAIHDVPCTRGYGEGSLSFCLDQFSALSVHLQQKQSETTLEEELRELFRVFDKHDTGFITLSEFKHIMSNLGEPLTEREANEFVREYGVDREW
jgi:Ca2+-binding EF-hand superfamily protein